MILPHRGRERGLPERQENFVIRRNANFERAKFNRRCKEEGENGRQIYNFTLLFGRALRIWGTSHLDDTGPYRYRNNKQVAIIEPTIGFYTDSQEGDRRDSSE